MLSEYLNKNYDDPLIEDMVRKTLQVRIIRESDTYLAPLIRKDNLQKYFVLDGIDNLLMVRDLKRPVFLLTGHVGSFYTSFQAVGSAIGKEVHTIARSVDDSRLNPGVKRLYEKINYKFTGKKRVASYIFTNYATKMARSLVPLSKSGSIFFVLLDLPRSLYPHKRLPVRFLNLTSSLPSNLVSWGIKQKGLFLTVWNTVSFIDEDSYIRRLTISRPFGEGHGVSEVLQEYADSLSAIIAKEPWQWMGVPIVNQFDESEHDHE
ncbi:MAG: hypothetical protein M0Z67_05130 [Nitrospiraceae bacterium]|nr:hypothetical protein [Nitrospiraceae bacterium]